jgi:SH3 domain-containing YSC84-like protein 1
VRSLIGMLALVGAGTAAVSAHILTREERSVQDSAALLNEIHSQPDGDIPHHLWDRALCVIVLPAPKTAAVSVDDEYRQGLMSWRHDGVWGSPVFMQLVSDNPDLHLGAESIDLVLLVMSHRGMDTMLVDKLSLGTDVLVAAGAVGRTAATAADAQPDAEVIAYSRARGFLAGMDLSGGVLKPDQDANRDLYGCTRLARKALTDGPGALAVTKAFMTALHTEDEIALP